LFAGALHQAANFPCDGSRIGQWRGAKFCVKTFGFQQVKGGRLEGFLVTDEGAESAGGAQSDGPELKKAP